MKYSIPYVAVVAALGAFSASADEKSSRWGLGLGAVVSDNPYAGREARYLPIPLLTYDSNRLFFQGITAGVHLLDTSALEIDLVAEGNFDGIDVEDLGVPELARNGIDRALLEDRKDSVDVGFDMKFSGRYGELNFQARADVLDASGGYEAGVSYGYPIALSERLQLTPGAGARWQSADRADYYYGILDEEVARGVTNYRPGSVVIPEVGLDLSYAFADRWLMLGDIKYRALPSKVEDSPLLDSGQSMGVFIGVLRAF
ncbi:MipA/OmpV family protein [Steroidobacter sp. S1-65]|uniref:MipA/OmpV family protein n=1 Tax=Steroidobacter gossypii TaxID=2805490 RepID=A0ABS1X048_9GAMM|nr:MipA/OmpV family protein [Steroidobacter gossypii]MBM0106596.1 MipA/OmpV family protein [Steroidobacter gossypii]